MEPHRSLVLFYYAPGLVAKQAFFETGYREDVQIKYDERTKYLGAIGHLIVNIVVFEDSQVGDLDPVTMGRAAFAVSCGSYCLLDWLRGWPGELRLCPRAYLRDVLFAKDASLGSELNPNHEYSLIVNGRLVPARSNIESLKKLSQHAGEACVKRGDTLCAAKVSTSRILDAYANHFADSDVPGPTVELACCSLPSLDMDLDTIDELQHLIAFHERCVHENLAHRIETGDYQQVRDGVFRAGGESLDPLIATDTSRGPIVIESGCQLGPFVFLAGPVHLAAGVRVAEHAALKHGVCVGPSSKVGGEIECAIFEAYSNKQHHGFLGHSYLGSWVNLGAGTSNSDLKNTYGNIRMIRKGKKVDTGTQFLGCFVGDYAKTSINTSIFAGKTIGVGSMVYGCAAADVPPFVNDASMMGQLTEVDPQVVVATQRRMFERRGVEQLASDRRLIEMMFEQSQSERTDLRREPLQW